MPKVIRDDLLLEEVRKVIVETGGCSSAARKLDLDKVLLWRFQKSGCAIERNRLTFWEAIERYKNETKSTKSKLNETISERDVSVPLNDLRAIRSFCLSMMTLVDAYEQLATGTQPVSAVSSVESDNAGP